MATPTFTLRTLANLNAAMANATSMLAALPPSDSKTVLETTFAAVAGAAKATKALLGSAPKQDIKESTVKVEVIDTGDAGIDRWTMLITITSDITTEFGISTPLACNEREWDRFLNHGARTIGGPNLRDAWISKASDEDELPDALMYELRSYNPSACLSLLIPGRILLPELRTAVQQLFAHHE